MKICAKCKHYTEPTPMRAMPCIGILLSGIQAYCKSPNTVDLVTGYHRACDVCRFGLTSQNSCGADGKYWEQREAPEGET